MANKGAFFQKFQSKISVIGKDGSHAKLDEPTSKTRPSFDEKDKKDELRPWRANPTQTQPAAAPTAPRQAGGSATRGDMAVRYGAKGGGGLDRQSADRRDGPGPLRPADPPPAMGQQDSGDLAYSRKARPVDYTPYTERDYRALLGDGYFELGKLGPDLDPDELAEKRLRQERVRAYADSVRQENRQQAAFAPPPRPAPKPASNRQKAIEFARGVPRPKPRADPAARPRGAGGSGGEEEGEEGEEEEEETELQRRQRRHLEDRALVEEMRRQLRGQALA
jgi:hypothetical protein